MFSKSYITIYLIVVFFVLSVSVLSIRIDKPFVGQHDFNYAQEGNAARNYLKYGLLELKLGQVIELYSGDPKNINSFYTSYLPTTPLLVAFSFYLFGIDEWVARIFPILISSFGCVFFFLIVKKLTNLFTAFISTLFFIFNPMYIYYGKMTVPDPLILGLMLVSFYFYIDWIEKSKNLSFFLFCIFILLAGLIGWPIVYFIPLMLVHLFIFKKLSKRVLIPIFLIISTILVQILHGYILYGDFRFFEILSKRLYENNLNFGGSEFTIFNYLRQELTWIQAYYTRILIILGLIYWSFVFIEPSKKTVNLNLIFLLFFGLGHIVLFSRMVFIHDYLNIYLLPYLAFAGGVGLIKILDHIGRFKNKIITISIFIVIFTLFFIERLEFTKALLSTEMNKQGYDMAQLLNKIQTSDKQAVIVSPRFASFYGMFTDFYSEKDYDITNESIFENEDYRSKYRYIITIDEDIKDKRIYEYLISTYVMEKMDDITLIYLDKRNE